MDYQGPDHAPSPSILVLQAYLPDVQMLEVLDELYPYRAVVCDPFLTQRCSVNK